MMKFVINYIYNKNKTFVFPQEKRAKRFISIKKRRVF